MHNLLNHKHRPLALAGAVLLIACALIIVGVSTSSTAIAQDAQKPETPEPAPAVAGKPAPDFATHIKPILEVHCVKCHREGKAKGKLRLDTLELAMKGGDSGPAISKGKPEDSELLYRVTLPHDDDEIMPPEDDPLTKDQTALLHTWIATGAHWPEGLALKPAEAAAPVVLENQPPDPNLVSIAILPASVTLETAADFHKVVIHASYKDGTTRDVTSETFLKIGDDKLATLNGNAIRPKADGATNLTASFRAKSATIPVTVKEASKAREVSFNLDIMPILTKSGCNTGSCHGAARGREGFMLSLFGYDPEGDHFRITRQMSGRRINLALAAESLLVEKATEKVPHVGGKRFEPGTEFHDTLVAWIHKGALNDPSDIAKPTSIEILPRQAVLEGVGSTQRFTVMAKYSDGTDRDVTRLCAFTTSNSNSATVDDQGVITSGERGEAFIMARFATFTEGSQVIVIPKGLQYTRPALAENNYIDKLVYEKLNKLRIIPSELCSDEIFLRRATLDITGALPTEEEYIAFDADKSPDKRAKLIDRLIDRKSFTEMWVMKWAELLQIRTNPNNQVSYKATLLYYNWLQDRIARNVPFNKIVQELLSASGGTFTNPASNYFQIERDTLKLAENCAQVFMGMRLQCAQCHNHPFDRWTQNDYYSFASFFSQIGRKRAEDPREVVVYNRRSGETNHPLTKKSMAPKFLGGAVPEVKGKDRRAVLAEWLASPENPFFARNLSNIVWAHFFGVGIIDPVDDVRVSNPASNPELLDELARRFTEYNYDFKRLVRDICNSRVYQLATKTNETNAGDNLNFSHGNIRRVRAEILLDVVSQVTNTKNKFQGLPLGARAVQIADGNVSNYFLTTFGRATRQTVCSCEVKMEPNLSQALHLLNGDVTHNRIRQGKVVETLWNEKLPPEGILEKLYTRTISRKPTDTEKQRLMAVINEEKEDAKKREVLEDIFWALLNSKEFLFNH